MPEAEGRVLPGLAPTRRQIPGVGGRRYKTEIASVSPVSARGTFEEHDACFLGISLENSNFAPKKLSSMVTWISRRFERCTVLSRKPPRRHSEWARTS